MHVSVIIAYRPIRYCVDQSAIADCIYYGVYNTRLNTAFVGLRRKLLLEMGGENFTLKVRHVKTIRKPETSRDIHPRFMVCVCDFPRWRNGIWALRLLTGGER